MVFTIETIKIDFGRLPEWNCPIPDTDAKSVAVHNEVTTVQSSTDITTTSQSSLKEVNTICSYKFYSRLSLSYFTNKYFTGNSY